MNGPGGMGGASGDSMRPISDMIANVLSDGGSQASNQLPLAPTAARDPDSFQPQGAGQGGGARGSIVNPGAAEPANAPATGADGAAGGGAAPGDAGGHGPSGAEPDMEKLAEKVWQVVRRKLALERERRSGLP
jgi:hypothetical protein